MGVGGIPDTAKGGIADAAKGGIADAAKGGIADAAKGGIAKIGGADGGLGGSQTAFIEQSAQTIGDVRNAMSADTGQKLGQRLENSAGLIGEQATRLAVTEGAAKAANLVLPGGGEIAVRAALSTKVGQKVVDKVSKKGGEKAQRAFRTGKTGLMIGAGLFVLWMATLMAVMFGEILLITGSFKEGNDIVEGLQQRLHTQVESVAPHSFYINGYAGRLSSLTAAAVGVLMDDWAASNPDLVTIEWERVGTVIAKGGVRLAGEDPDGNIVVSEYWYYQYHLEGCHPAALTARGLSTQSMPPVNSACWATDFTGGNYPDRSRVLSWLVPALGGVREVWQPPLYDIAHCMQIVDDETACEAAFDRPPDAELAPANYATGYYQELPTLDDILFTTVQTTPTTLDLEALESGSRVGQLGQTPLSGDGIRFVQERLVSEGAVLLANDVYTAWLAWHNPNIHVPFHVPPVPPVPPVTPVTPAERDLECAYTYIDGGVSNGQFSITVGTDFDGGSTPRGEAWVDHFTTMGSELSAPARGDVLAGCVTREMLGLLGYMAARKSFGVSPLRSSHAPTVASTDRESYHHRGRAADIYAVEGELVEYGSVEGYWLWTLAVAFKQNNNPAVEELGSPWELHDEVDGDGIFTNDDHLDHIHIGVCGVRFTEYSNRGGAQNSC